MTAVAKSQPAGMHLGNNLTTDFFDEMFGRDGQVLAGAGLGAVLSAAAFDSLSFAMSTACTALFAGIAGAYWRLSRTESYPGTSTVAEAGVLVDSP